MYGSTFKYIFFSSPKPNETIMIGEGGVHVFSNIYYMSDILCILGQT